MYLKLQQGTMGKEMEEINKLIRKLFHYITSAEKPDRETLNTALGKDGSWLMRHYGGLESRLLALMEEDLDEKRKIEDILNHDMEFEHRINDSSFCFQEKLLSQKQTEKIRNLLLFLYDSLFYKGKTQAFGKRFSYGDFKKGLFRYNRATVCPACLEYQNDLEARGEVDHYLPKAKYPALIFHPCNLAAICTECNDIRVKKDEDVLEKRNLTEVYFPYLRAAESETTFVIKGKGGKFHVRLEPKASLPTQQVEKRIAGLEQLFHLEERWSKRADHFIEREMDYLETIEDRAEVEQYLKGEARKQRIQSDRNKEVLIEAACLAFLCERGREALIDDWNRRKEERRSLAASSEA